MRRADETAPLMAYTSPPLTAILGQYSFETYWGWYILHVVLWGGVCMSLLGWYPVVPSRGLGVGLWLLLWLGPAVTTGLLLWARGRHRHYQQWLAARTAYLDSPRFWADIAALEKALDVLPGGTP